MFKPQAIHLRDRAAGRVIDGIRRLSAEVEEPLADLLSQVAARLFDSRLGATALWRGIPSPARWRPRFQALTGCDLRAYIRSCRLRVAREMLAEPTLTVAQIASLSAFPSQAAFRRTFFLIEGLSPERWRPQGAPDSSLAPRLSDPLRQALNGVLPASAAREVVGSLTPEEEESESLPSAMVAMSRRQAERLWRTLAPLPPALRLRGLRTLPPQATPSLFHLLVEKSRVLGRANRGRAVAIAELALESLERVKWDSQPVGERKRLEALGWAWLGSAHCQAFELSDAEGALDMAEALASPESRGEIELIRGQLLWYQRRLPEADSKLREALGFLREHGARDILACALILRGAVASGRGEPAAGLSCLEEATGLARVISDDHLLLCALQSFARALLALERWAEAEGPLAEARILQARVGGREGSLQIAWLEALLDLGRQRPVRACAGLTRVRDGFASLGSPGHAALAGLDLAQAWQAADNPDKVVATVAEAMPLLQSLRNANEAQAAVELLRGALASKMIRPAVLARTRQALASTLALPQPDE